ncbi:hypothetical protein QL285_096512 [Trifolium repens]|nr:hypothetical protein QL285_096512 [Trifolium repens]
MEDDGRFVCVFHYGGCFINKTTLEYVGKDSEWRCDSDKWSYWEILDILKGKGVHPDHILGMWYNDPTKELGVGLSEIKDDKDEVDDNGHCEVIRQISAIGLDNENDVHSEIFGHGYYSEKDDKSDKSDDSVREVVFDDSEEESDANGGFPLLEYAPQSPPPSTVQGKKNTKKGKESTKKDKGKKQVIRKKGRPKKDVGKKPQHEYFSDHSDDDSLYDERDVAKEMKQNKVARGLSDDDYATDELESDSECELEGEEGELGEVVPREKFATFVQPKNMRDYKWEEGTYFVTKKSFTEAVRTYSVHSNRMVKFVKNDKRRIRGKCQGAGCNLEIYNFYLRDKETWQLRKVSEKHDCPREPHVNLLSSDWLSNRLQSTVKENPAIKLTAIVERTQKKWNNSITKGMAYRAKEKAVDLVNGSFREQYTRLHDYAHELLRTNAGSTVVIAAQDYVPTEADVEAPERPICPHFQRILYTFISDQQKGLLQAIDELLPGVDQRFCKPIVTMMEEIRVYLMERWQKNREAAAKFEGSVLPKIKKKLEKEIEHTNMWMARQSGEFFFEVQKPEDYIPNYYRNETYEVCYAPLIYPVGGQSVWVKTQYTDLQPPPIRRQPGRPKKRRNREEGELRREPGMLNKKGMKQACRRCGETGHNKSTCKLPPPPPPPPTPAATTTATTPANTPPATAPATTPVIAPTNASGAVAATRKSPRHRDKVPATQPAMPTRKSPRNREELPATQPAVPTTKSPVKRKRVESSTQPAPATRKSPIKRNKTDQTATPKNQGNAPPKNQGKAPPKAPTNAPPKAPFKPPRSSQKQPFKP